MGYSSMMELLICFCYYRERKLLLIPWKTFEVDYFWLCLVSKLQLRRRVKQVPLAFYKATPTFLFSESDFPGWTFNYEESMGNKFEENGCSPAKRQRVSCSWTWVVIVASEKPDSFSTSINDFVLVLFVWNNWQFRRSSLRQFHMSNYYWLYISFWLCRVHATVLFSKFWYLSNENYLMRVYLSCCAFSVCMYVDWSLIYYYYYYFISHDLIRVNKDKKTNNTLQKSN